MRQFIAMLVALEKSTRAAAVYGILAYQKHLSPRKGFRCAHRALHGELSCSEYIRRVLIENNWPDAMAMARSRFRECREAFLLLKSDSPFDDSTHSPAPQAEDKKTKNRKTNDKSQDASGWDCCIHLPCDAPCHLLPRRAAFCDATPCDVTPCDCMCWPW